MRKNSEEIYNILNEMFPNAKCELNYETPFELIVAVILSAQCTDKRVNQVTESLFKVASTPEDYVNMPIQELEQRIFSCGFYKNKAKNIKQMAEEIMTIGYVPNTQEKLQELSGVGRKTANVVYSEAFKGNAIAVDTHVFRVSNRLGLANSKTPEETEKQLQKVYPEEYWSKLHHLLIFLGRYVCKSQKPDCDSCGLKEYCKYYKTVIKK